MKALPQIPELLNVAQRVVWFKKPNETLAHPIHFLAHAMTYGTLEDLHALSAFITDDDYREVLDNAPPGVFDPRSWAYWNLILGRSPAPPLPTRKGLSNRTPAGIDNSESERDRSRGPQQP